MARKYDYEYKVQALKLAKEIGGAKAAKELGIPEVLSGRLIAAPNFKLKQAFFRLAPSKRSYYSLLNQQDICCWNAIMQIT